jgi:hypothetical protein
MEYKNFKSANGELIYVTSLSGHSVVLTGKFKSVPDILWSQAYALGGLSEDMKVASIKNHIEEKRLEALAKEAEERAIIKEKMQIAYQNPALYLDTKNKLIQRKVVSLLKQPIKRDLMDEIWSEIVIENEGK